MVAAAAEWAATEYCTLRSRLLMEVMVTSDSKQVPLPSAPQEVPALRATRDLKVLWASASKLEAVSPLSDTVKSTEYAVVGEAVGARLGALLGEAVGARLGAVLGLLGVCVGGALGVPEGSVVVCFVSVISWRYTTP